MAARKSCTHMTWAEAKAKGGDGPAVTKKKGNAPKKLNHAEKIIAKNGASKEVLAKERKKERRFEERAAAISQKRAEERLQQRLENQKVKPSEQAKKRMSDLASKEQQLEEPPVVLETTTYEDLTELQTIAQCKEMQLDEIMALEAIFGNDDDGEDDDDPNNSNKLLISVSSKIEELREKIEAYQSDEENESVLQSIQHHPPVSLLLQLTIPDVNQTFSVETESELVASLLLRVTFPSTYPLMTTESPSTPQFDIVYFIITDRLQECSADKPLLSLAHFEETKFLTALKTEAEQLLPDLCVYEAAVTWLTENLFQDTFIEMITNN